MAASATVITQNPPLVLVVIDGRQSGSRIALRQDSPMTVGVRLDCDVVLEAHALATAGQHQSAPEPVLRLTRDATAVEVEVLSGEVVINNRRLQSGDTASVAVGEIMTLGSTSITLEQSALTPAADTVLPLAATPKTLTLKPAWTRRVAMACGLVVGLWFVAIGFSQQYTNAENQLAEVTAPLTVQSMLAAEGFDALLVEAMPGQRLRVAGFVDTHGQLITVKSLLAPLGERVTLSIDVGEGLRDAVASLYRLHGIEASVQVTAPGTVAVETAVADTELLAQVEQALYADVAMLQQLVSSNSPPAVVQEKSSAEDVPGKRIVAVIATEPAYLLTEDGSRYFPGSMLPNGYRIKTIKEQKVDLIRDDEHLELVF